MRYLIVLAHGSRREQSNEEIRELTRNIACHSDNTYAATECAFLEIAQPSIPDVIDKCIAQGATSIVALPYFLSDGNHVATDIPKIFNQKKAQYPDVNMELKDYVGKAPEMLSLVVDRALSLN
ncbi:MAG: sirohydrochlorin ferrochelatase [Polaribacter sp.]|jgi:sirohydrochlorin ferrochelatase